MHIQLTKLTDKFLCIAYKEFLSKRKDGHSIDASTRFKNNFEEKDSFIFKFNQADIPDILRELKSHDLISVYISGNFQLTTNAIIYMENRFKNGLIEVTDFISKFIP